MNRNFRLALAAGALIVAACGDDSGTEGNDTGNEPGGSTSSNDAGTPKSDASSGTNRDGGDTTTESPSTGTGGKCGKGEYKYDDPELSLCPASDADDSCPAISKFAGYTSFDGDLNLYASNNDELTAASCLQTVSGRLTISDGVNVTSLESLSSVKSLSGLSILGMDKLTTLAGFDNLKVLIQLTINANDGITDITGLPQGLKVQSLYVQGNKALSSLDGLLASKIEIEKTLAFENNPKLSSCVVAEFAKNYPNAELSAFSNLTEVCK